MLVKHRRVRDGARSVHMANEVYAVGATGYPLPLPHPAALGYVRPPEV